jgi:hypothetical protein
MIQKIVQTSYQEKLIEPGDLLVITAGLPFGTGGRTNFLKIHDAGEAGEIPTDTGSAAQDQSASQSQGQSQSH